jgi:hypothetical protein
MSTLRALLFAFFLTTSAAVAQNRDDDAFLAGRRARSESFAVSIAQPEGWQAFQGDPKTPAEVLFLQSPETGPLDATISLSAYPMPHAWADLLRRQTFQLVVELDAPVLSNEALTMRGARGHKWAYRALSKSGEEKLYYRLYLALPASVGPRRLLVMAASAPAAQESDALDLFNGLARSLSWGDEPAP